MDHIRVQPQAGRLKGFYTAESLLQALPHLHEASFGRHWAFGTTWLWQKGIIYLNNGGGIHWRSFTDNVVVIESSHGPVFYTDLQSQAFHFADGKINRTIHAWQGARRVVIDLY